jgi:hypothetical protein
MKRNAGRDHDFVVPGSAAIDYMYEKPLWGRRERGDTIVSLER